MLLGVGVDGAAVERLQRCSFGAWRAEVRRELPGVMERGPESRT